MLLIEDDAELAHWLVRALSSSPAAERPRVEWADDGRLGASRLAAERFDCVVLDLQLPGMSGMEFLRRMRAGDDRTPVLVLTASGGLDQRVEALMGGADDFLAKPFAIEELEARLHALVRRSRGGDQPRLRCGDLVFDLGSRRFQLAGSDLALTPREHAALRALIQRSGEPVAKRELTDRVFEGESDAGPDAIEVVIHRLRKKLVASGVAIVTSRGLGYLLSEQPAAGSEGQRSGADHG